MKFSVVISVYRNDKPEFVEKTLDSVTTLQTCKPAEIVLVVDGPIPDAVDRLLSEREKVSNGLYHIIRLPENEGLGNALKAGVEAAKYPIIARMDSDDIAVSCRFEKQLAFMETHPEYAVVGGQIAEFIDDINNVVGHRILPLNDAELKLYLKSRCPFNHVTVMLRKDAVLATGNYMDWHYNEDYYLWIRMAEAGCKFANLPDTLVNVRVGKDMYRRRGGWQYFKSEERIQRYMLRHKTISLPRYVYNVAGRFAVQVAMPNWLRGFVFQKMFRK